MTATIRVLVTTVPFGEVDRRPLEILEAAGVEVVVNPLNRKLTSADLASMIPGIDYLIAGTEMIDDAVLSKADRLKLIARVGIGLDSVDLNAARRRGIPVTYTPDAPSEAVADLTIGLILSCLRQIHTANARMHRGEWHRHFGRRLGELTVGLVGLGRIGSGVARRLGGFNPRRVLGHDLLTRDQLRIPDFVELVDFEQLVSESDVVSIHVPLNGKTRDWFDQRVLSSMKLDAVLVNTARGGIVNETDLLQTMTGGHLSAVALDVFDVEPYSGPLSEIERVLLTSHMGSMSVDSRTRMEVEAAEEVARAVLDLAPLRPVPETAYESKV